MKERKIKKIEKMARYLEEREKVCGLSEIMKTFLAGEAQGLKMAISIINEQEEIK